AKMLGSNARLGTVPCQVSQSRVRGERSGGGGYCHAPVGSLRPSHPSTSIRSPSVPCAISSLALAQIWELTRCEPICTMRPVFFAALTMATPSTGLGDGHETVGRRYDRVRGERRAGGSRAHAQKLTARAIVHVHGVSKVTWVRGNRTGHASTYYAPWSARPDRLRPPCARHRYARS